MINQMIAELRMIESRTRRQWEDDAAERANNRDYNLSQESKDALARGDRQRASGIYQTGQITEKFCPATMIRNGIFGEHLCGLEYGHKGSHQCTAVSFCNTTWED